MEQYEQLRVEAQQAADELLEEKLIPFKLVVGEVVPSGFLQCKVSFVNSVLDSVLVALREGASFKSAVRLALLLKLPTSGFGLR